MDEASKAPTHGYGVRVPHYDELLTRPPNAEVVEVVTENFLGRGGRPRALLERLRSQVPVVLHGVSLCIGSTDPLSQSYLNQLRDLIAWLEPNCVSDHLCFGSFGGHYAHDLWPLPLTEEAIAHVAQRVRQVQDFLGRQIALENISSYAAFAGDQVPEAEFLAAVADASDCLILLDINNVIVNAYNHGLDADAYLAKVPKARVAQYHMAGHAKADGFLLDDHGSAAPPSVMALYGEALRQIGPRCCILEWDERVPTLQQLEAETERIRLHAKAATSKTRQSDAS